MSAFLADLRFALRSLARRPGLVAVVIALVVRRALALTLAGLAAALGLSRLLESLLFEVSATDPRTYVAVAAVLLAVALVASVGPARRASRVDPIAALRDE